MLSIFLFVSGSSVCPSWISDADPGQQDLLWLQYENSHRLQKSCGEKGAAWPLSNLERGPLTSTWTGFYCFSGHITSRMILIYHAQVHHRWLPFKDDKDRTLLITSKRRMLQLKGEAAHPPYLGDLTQTLGRWRYSVNICCFNSGWGSFSKSKSHSSQGTMQAWFPTGEPVCGCGSCPPTSLPTGFSEWGLSHISHAWNGSP